MKKALAILLAVFSCIAMLPANAFAAMQTTDTSVVCVDTNSNPYSGDWTLSPSTPFFKFNGPGWWSDGWGWMYLNSDANPGSSVDFTFTGTSIALSMNKYEGGGKAAIYIDGALVTTVDTYQAGALASVKVFEQMGLTAAKHVLTVKEAGKSITGAAGIMVTAFEYTPSGGDPNPQPALVRVDTNSNPYSGDWTLSPSTPFFKFNGPGWWSDGWGWMYLNSDVNQGSSVDFTFTGTSIALSMNKYEGGGKAAIYIDGALVTTVDTYQAGALASVKVFEQTGLTAAKHVLTVKEAGKSITGAAGIMVTAFEYTPSGGGDPNPQPALVRVDTNSNPFSGDWGGSTNTPFFKFTGGGWWSDGWGWMYLSVDENPNSFMEFTFTGTTIALYGEKLRWGGKADIYLDGVLKTTVDTYQDVDRQTQKIFELTGLPGGSHTLKVQVAGKSVTGVASLMLTAFEYTPGAAAANKIISVTSPAYYSDVRDAAIDVSFNAPGLTHAKAYSLHAPDATNSNPYGYMKPVAEDIPLDAQNSGTFRFNAADFPYGPVSIRITAWNDDGNTDDCYLQLFNYAGTPWDGGPANDKDKTPSALTEHHLNMQTVFSDDFTEMPTISYTGVGEDVKYAAAKPDPVNWPEYGSAKFTPPNYSYGNVVSNYSPFAVVGNQYMRFETKDWGKVIEPKWGQKFTTAFLASMGSDGSNFVTKPGAAQYFETRLFLAPNPGLWPAFWTLTPDSPDGRPGNDELDVLEAYMGGNPETTTYNHHTWGDNYLSIHAGGSASTNDYGNKINLAEGWHTYGMLITEDQTYYYFDDHYIPGSAHPTLDRSWTVGNYFMVNNAYRQTDADKYPGGFQRYGSTAEMYVDWVKVYQVENTGFTAMYANMDVTPGKTVSVDIVRADNVKSLSGTYNISAPAGWTVVSGGSFAAGSSKDTIVLNVPANYDQFQGTVTVTPVSGGTQYTPVTVKTRTEGLVSTEVFPTLNAAGNGTDLQFKLFNSSSSALSNITVTASGPSGWTQTKTFPVIAARSSQVLSFSAPLADPYALQSYSFSVKLTDDYSLTVTRPVSGLVAVKAQTPVTIDGTVHADQWTGAMGVTIDKQAQSSGTWNGADDLSATAKTKWDDNYLYVAVEVKDDVHSMTQNNIVDAWQGDSLQISLDPARAAGPVSGGPHLSLTAALNSNTGTYGIAVDRCDYSDLNLNWGQLLTQSKCVVKRDEAAKTTTYTLALAWSEIRPSAFAGTKDYGLAFVVNDSDGTGREGWMRYMDGIATGKDPAKFGDLELSDKISVEPAPNAAPVLAPVSDKTVAAGSTLAFTANATDADGDALTYSAANLPAGASFNAQTGAFSWTPTVAQAGSYTVTLTVSDGRASDSKPVQITVSTAATPVSMTEQLIGVVNSLNINSNKKELLTKDLGFVVAALGRADYKLAGVKLKVFTTHVASFSPNFLSAAQSAQLLQAAVNIEFALKAGA